MSADAPSGTAPVRLARCALEPVPAGPVRVRSPGADAGAVDRSVAEAFEAHRVDLFSFALRSTRDPDAAEDLVAEAYLRLLAEARLHGLPDNARAWLYRVVANLAVSRLRRAASALRWRRLHRADALAVSAEDAVLHGERRDAVDAALARLPRDARVGLLLAAAGFSGAEVARAIGRSELATRSLLSRARVRLRDELERGGGRG